MSDLRTKLKKDPRVEAMFLAFDPGGSMDTDMAEEALDQLTQLMEEYGKECRIDELEGLLHASKDADAVEIRPRLNSLKSALAPTKKELK